MWTRESQSGDSLKRKLPKPKAPYALQLVHAESPEHKLSHALGSRQDGGLEDGGHLICGEIVFY